MNIVFLTFKPQFKMGKLRRRHNWKGRQQSETQQPVQESTDVVVEIQGGICSNQVFFFYNATTLLAVPFFISFVSRHQMELSWKVWMRATLWFFQPPNPRRKRKHGRPFPSRSRCQRSRKNCCRRFWKRRKRSLRWDNLKLLFL